MKISKEDLLAKYGISLEKGKYKITPEDGKYRIDFIKDDTSGCVLVGFKRELDKIWESANAESYLVKELLEASHKQILAITIENA